MMRKRFLKKQIEQFKVTVAAAGPLQKKAVGQSGDEATALTQLMVTNQIEKLRRDLTVSEKRLVLDLPIERDQIKKSIADNARAIEERRGKLKEIEIKLEGLHATKAVLPPTQSASPVAPRPLLIVALGTLAGLMASIFGAFLAEFFLKVRKETDVPLVHALPFPERRMAPSQFHRHPDKKRDREFSKVEQI